jgi:hypothetical protein
MPFVDEDEVGASYARWILRDALIRATARRLLALSIGMVIAALFVTMISTFGFGRPAPTPPEPQQAPVVAPLAHHAVVLVCASRRIA